MGRREDSFFPSHRTLRSRSSLATSSRSRPFAHSQSPNRSSREEKKIRKSSGGGRLLLRAGNWDEFCCVLKWEISARSTVMNFKKQNQNEAIYSCNGHGYRSLGDFCDFSNYKSFVSVPWV